MPELTSPDGTTIAYQRAGSGPTLVLVGGALDDGTENAPLIYELKDDFTVFNYARRGRGESGDQQPYSVQREIEDLAALIELADGPAHVFGASSGGALALEAAAAGLPIARIVVYEVPYVVDDSVFAAWQGYRENLRTALAADRPDEAVAAFMRLAGTSDEDIAGARQAPFWPALEALGHTLEYDAACLGDGRPPAARLAKITQPTLVTTGTAVDPHMPGLPDDFFIEAADAIAAALPHARRRTVAINQHAVDAKAVAPVLASFCGG